MFQSKSYKYPKFFIVSGGTRVLVIALALFGSLSLASAQNRFVHLPSYPAGGSLPTLVAQHDVNGDGKLDLIVMNVNATTKLETVSLLPGTGTGGYQAPKTMAYFPVSYGKPLLADVNRDGHLDLIFSLVNSQSTRVYLGQGESFQSTPLISKGGACPTGHVCVDSDIQVADVNKDGNPDLLVLLIAPYYSALYISLGNGNGAFRAPVAVNPSDDSLNAYTTGDFNADGVPDIAAGGQIMLGSGDGTFRKGAIAAAGGGQLLAADLRGNGITDLVMVTSLSAVQANGDCRGGGVAVLLGNGDGTFAVDATFYKVGQYTYGAIIADVNGDHRPDILVANQLGASYSVLLNVGAGKFAPAVNYKSPEPVAGNFVVGDLNGDGRPDLTISSQTGVQVLRNTGGGALFAPVSLDLAEGFEPFFTYAADLNHDNIPDLAFMGSYNFNLPIPCRAPYDFGDGHTLLSSAGKAFSSLTAFGLPGSYPESFGLGDFNRDGNTDLAVDASPRMGPPDFNIQFNNGQGQFPTQGPTFSPTDTFNVVYGDIAVGDFNRDGLADVVLNGQPLLVGIGTGNGNFNFKTYPALGVPDTTPLPLTVRDLNGDGKLDLINVDKDGDAVEVLLGNGDGTFQTPKKYSTVQLPIGVVVADFNRDGKLDLAVAGDSQISMLLNNGNGTFKSAVTYPAGGPVSALAAISLLGNSNQSVLVADSKDNKLFLLAGNGTGTLAAPVNYYPGGGNPQGLTVADFNRDGASDVAVTDWTTSSYMILYNTGGTSIKLTTSNAKPLAGQSVTLTATVAASIAGTGTPSGTVTFKNGSATLGTVNLSGGKAVLNTAALTRGSHTITATYNGSGTFNTHVSTGLTVMVQ